MAFQPVQFVKTAYQNSPWVVISIAIHVALGAVISFVAFQKLTAKEDKPVAVNVKQETLPPPPEQPPETIERKQVPKNEEAEVVSFEEDIYVPTTEQQEDLHKKRGDPTAADNLPPGATGGTAIGVGNAGHYGNGVSAFSGRRPGGGGGGRGGGPTQGTEAAVLDGLRWLARHQMPDGSWSAASIRERCSEKAKCIPDDAVYIKNYDEGLTALALLCFLGGGYDTNSKQYLVDEAMGKKYYFKDIVLNGLKWLKDHQKEDGSFSSPKAFMYNEALGALALSEAYGMTQNKAWKEPAQRAINYLMRAQKPDPSNTTALWGWRYTSREDIEARNKNGEFQDAKGYDSEMREADTSVTTWVVMALKSANLAGLNVDAASFAGAKSFIEYVTAKSGKDAGLVGYLTPDGAGQALGGHNEQYKYHTAVMSALGMLCRTFIDHNIDDPMLEAGAKFLIKDPPEVSKDRLSVDYYYWYYGSLALNQYDGPDSPRSKHTYWESWNEHMKDSVLALQDKNNERDVCSRGGWLTPDRWSYAGGPIYATAINVLTLEVYYRYANAFTGHERGPAKGKSTTPAKDAKKPEAKPESKPDEKPAEKPKDGKGN